MMRVISFQGLVASVLCLAASAASIAAPRALLVGIGDYALKDADLPGIDLDIQNMRELTALMGFKPEEVRVLMDREATLARVSAELRTWLRDGVGAEDPVLLYFSGHGTRIPDLDGDEPDGADEVLLMHDAAWIPASRGGAASMRNVLVDDELGRILAAIPSRRVLVLIDACNSGTATRNVAFATRSLGVADGVRKFVTYEGMPEGGGGLLERNATGAGATPNYVAISAAEDTQYAIATSQGGVFTLGVHKAIREAVAAGRQLTAAGLRDEAAAYIKSKLEPRLVHNPVTSGSPTLAGAALPLPAAPSHQGGGPTWTALVDIARRGKSLPLTAGKDSYAIGEEIELLIDVPADGYLNLITVDAADQTTVLFPNRYQADNKVKAGKLVIPDAAMPFTLPAVEPAGPTLVVALLSSGKVNALDLGIEGRDSTGAMQEIFTALSPSATRAIGVAAREPGFMAGQVVISIAPRSGAATR